MDALREGVYLRGYAQKDPLIEYKTEAYDMFVELMANIKNEVLHNLFRSTSNLQAFENFLATLAAVSCCANTRRPLRPQMRARARVSPSQLARWHRQRTATARAKYRSIFRFGDQYRKSAATNRARAAAGKNTRTAAADGRVSDVVRLESSR